MKKLMIPLALAASAAWAEAPATFLSDVKKPLESPRSMFLEVKLGSFFPDIDAEFAGPGVDETTLPYYAVFGGGGMLLGEIEAEYQLFQKFGSLAIGASVGYAEKYGKALDAVTGVRTDQTNGMRLIPIKALLVYRWDYAKIRWNVPLVPYLKGGAVIMPWFVYSGGEVEQFGVKMGAGTSFGLTGTFGVALQLDFIDPRLARDFDSSVGVNHTYLFAEGTINAMSLFATGDKPLNFSSRFFMFGLGFEF